MPRSTAAAVGLKEPPSSLAPSPIVGATVRKSDGSPPPASRTPPQLGALVFATDGLGESLMTGAAVLHGAGEEVGRGCPTWSPPRIGLAVGAKVMPAPAGAMAGGVVSPLPVVPGSGGADVGADEKMPSRIPPVGVAVGADVGGTVVLVVGVGVGEAGAFGAGAGVGIAVGKTVSVFVAVGVATGIAAGSAVVVAVGIIVGADENILPFTPPVDAAVGVAVTVAVAVGIAVSIAVCNAVEAAVGIAVAATVAVAVGVPVGVVVDVSAAASAPVGIAVGVAVVAAVAVGVAVGDAVGIAGLGWAVAKPLPDGPEVGTNVNSAPPLAVQELLVGSSTPKPVGEGVGAPVAAACADVVGDVVGAGDGLKDGGGGTVPSPHEGLGMGTPTDTGGPEPGFSYGVGARVVVLGAERSEGGGTAVGRPPPPAKLSGELGGAVAYSCQRSEPDTFGFGLASSLTRPGNGVGSLVHLAGPGAGYPAAGADEAGDGAVRERVSSAPRPPWLGEMVFEADGVEGPPLGLWSTRPGAALATETGESAGYGVGYGERELGVGSGVGPALAFGVGA